MSSSRDRQLQTARELDKISTILVDAGVRFVKSNPRKVGLYIFGILLCFFFNGWTVTPQQQALYDLEIQKLDHQKLDEAAHDVTYWGQRYRQTKGWFTCDKRCAENKRKMDFALKEYSDLQKIEEAKISNAKSKLGIFSAYGVAETRDLFWERFAQGKSFATRQSKWDAIFMGIGAMARDENMMSYALRVIMNVLFNFTLGVCGAVVAFIFGLYSVIVTYRAPIYTALIFFACASVAAMSFALTWLLCLYFAAAGTIYVGAKIAATNVRLEDGRRPPRSAYVRS